MTHQSIHLQVPAETSYIGLVRTATLGFASRLDFPIDQLDELSHAAHEITSLLLADTSSEEHIYIELSEPTPTTVSVTAKSRTNRGKTPRTDTFAWTILSALVDEVRATTEDGFVVITATRSIQPFSADSDSSHGGSSPDSNPGSAGDRTEAAL